MPCSFEQLSAPRTEKLRPPPPKQALLVFRFCLQEIVQVHVKSSWTSVSGFDWVKGGSSSESRWSPNLDSIGPALSMRRARRFPDRDSKKKKSFTTATVLILENLPFSMRAWMPDGRDFSSWKKKKKRSENSWKNSVADSRLHSGDLANEKIVGTSTMPKKKKHGRRFRGQPSGNQYCHLPLPKFLLHISWLKSHLSTIEKLPALKKHQLVERTSSFRGFISPLQLFLYYFILIFFIFYWDSHPSCARDLFGTPQDFRAMIPFELETFSAESMQMKVCFYS